MSPQHRAPNGSGSVWRRKDGRWVAALYVTEADGRRVRQVFYGPTRAVVEGHLVEARAKVEAGRPMPPSQLTLAAFLKEWLDTIVAKRVRPNTLAAYRFNVDTYLVPELGSRRLRRLSARDVRLFLAGLERRGTGARTGRYVHATLRAALEDAVREELLDRNVAKLVRAPSVPRAERHPLSVEELRVLFDANEDDRLRPMLIVLALLGLRRSEVLGLQWPDVDLERGTLRVCRGLHRVNGGLQLLPTKTARVAKDDPAAVHGGARAGGAPATPGGRAEGAR